MEFKKLTRAELVQTFILDDYVLIAFFMLLKLLIHLSVNLAGGYGYFRDELYYIACSDHLAWGYVDQPPLSIGFLWLSRLLLGDSLFALRFLPAILGSLTIGLAMRIVRELGGKRFAQILAALSILAAPLTTGTNSYYSMNSFDLFFWTFAVYLILLILKNDAQWKWIALGIVLGLGLMNKISVMWLGAAFCLSLMLTPKRKVFLTRKVWIAAGIAVFLFVPYILWQISNVFPTLEFMHNALTRKYVAMAPWELFLQQMVVMNPLTFPIWITGLGYFLFSRSTKQFRVLPLLYLVVFIILVAGRNSKSEYLGPLFPMLFALGSFAFEKFITRRSWNWSKPVAICLILFSGIVMAPFAIPLLPVGSFISYSKMLGIAPSTPERKQLSQLPQYYADMFGWEKMTAAVADAYYSLTPEARAECVILCDNYGEAGAIDFFGRQYNLPKAISGHNNYWLWGCRNSTGKVVIRLGGSLDLILKSYTTAMLVEVFSDQYCMPYENNKPVYICLDRKTPLSADWPEFKHFE